MERVISIEMLYRPAYLEDLNNNIKRYIKMPIENEIAIAIEDTSKIKILLE